MANLQLEEVKEDKRIEFNRFVMQQQSGSFLQSWEWGEWQENLGRRILRYWILDDIGKRIGSIQLIQMPLPFGKHYLYAPYGPGVDGKLENLNSKLETIFKELKSKFPNAVFIRIEPKFNLPATRYPLLAKSVNIQPAKTLAINLSKSEEQMLSEMHPKTRYNIKVAQKHGVKIQDEFVLNIGQGFYFEPAIDLIVATARRQGYGGYGKEYYRKMIDFFGLQNYDNNLKLHIYKALYNNQLLAGAIMMDFGQVRTFLFGGSADLNKNVMAPYLLHWQAIKDAQVAGFKFYDFWGVETASGQTPGFVRFKLGFGGEIISYAGAYDLVNSPFGYKMYKLLRGMNRIAKKLSV